MQKSKPQNDVVVSGEEEDVEVLEESVIDMAQQILDYRNTFSNQLKTTFATLLESQRPVLPPAHSQPGPSSLPLGTSVGSPSEVSLMEENPEDMKRLELLKQKISSNASAIPDTLKRMRECMDRMGKLQSCKVVIHPAFKKKRLTD